MAAADEVVSIVDAVARGLRERVLAGELSPGTPLGEVDVATRYEVARPTAKAAIEKLVHERLLERRAHRTARVVRLSPDDVHDIYQARALIESQAVRELARARTVPADARAANERISALEGASPREVVEPDMRFHTSIVDALGNERASRMYGSLASEMVLCMSQVQGAALLPTGLIAEEHALILRHIESGDGHAAAEVLSGHLSRARDRLAARLAGTGPEDPRPAAPHPSEKTNSRS